MLFCHDGKMIPIANATNVTGPAGSWMGDGDGAPALLPVQHEYDPLNTDDLMYRLNNDVKCAPHSFSFKRLTCCTVGAKPKSTLASGKSVPACAFLPSLIPLGCSLT